MCSPEFSEKISLERCRSVQNLWSLLQNEYSIYLHKSPEILSKASLSKSWSFLFFCFSLFFDTNQPPLKCISISCTQGRENVGLKKPQRYLVWVICVLGLVASFIDCVFSRTSPRWCFSCDSGWRPLNLRGGVESSVFWQRLLFVFSRAHRQGGVLAAMAAQPSKRHSSNLKTGFYGNMVKIRIRRSVNTAEPGQHHQFKRSSCAHVLKVSAHSV